MKALTNYKTIQLKDNGKASCQYEEQCAKMRIGA